MTEVLSMNDEKVATISGAEVARLASCWRILHMMTSSYGSHPTGQIVIALTLAILHRTGYLPTVNEIAAATGIPKSNVSRYITWQLEKGLIEETIDPSNRRLRRLRQTEKGRVEMEWLDSQLGNVWHEISGMTERMKKQQAKADPKKILERMTELTRISERRLKT
jgi:DNA-binding MarR family transcriptional regulator